MASRSDKTPENGEKLPATKVAAKKLVSYQRVSTKDGRDKIRSGKAEAGQGSMAGEASLNTTARRTVERDLMSGRKKNRFDWFINGGYAPGTVLLVEDIDRFSRMEVEDGDPRAAGDLRQRSGRCRLPIRGRRLQRLEPARHHHQPQPRRPRNRPPELEKSRRESERKRERRLGARDRKYEAIREGNLNAAFKPRGKSKTAQDVSVLGGVRPQGQRRPRRVRVQRALPIDCSHLGTGPHHGRRSHRRGVDGRGLHQPIPTQGQAEIVER